MTNIALKQPLCRSLRSIFLFTTSVAVIALLLMLPGCNGCKNSPAAVTPISPSVLAVLKPGGPWTNVGANPSGQFEILPSGFPSGGLKIQFSAPYPTALHVQIDGADIPDQANVPAGTDPAQTGYFHINNINPNPNPALWEIALRPPNSKLASSTYVIGISDVSVNPNYPVGNSSHESAPLLITAVLQKVFTVTVMKTGNGRGDVTSTPAGITCGSVCTFDFGQSVTVTLKANAAGNAQFGGWSGPCSGTGDCTLTLNGTAAVATASFTSTSSQLQGCAAGQFMQGFVFLGQPGCATNDIAGHPSAMLQCDSSGYFCCELSQGSTDPKCGNDHRQFPPDCLEFAPQGTLKQPGGCYAVDTGP